MLQVATAPIVEVVNSKVLVAEVPETEDPEAELLISKDLVADVIVARFSWPGFL